MVIFDTLGRIYTCELKDTMRIAQHIFVIFLSSCLILQPAYAVEKYSSYANVFMGIGATMVSVAAIIGGYFYWHHTKKITQANAFLERVVKDEKLKDDQVHTQVQQALEQGANPNLMVSALTTFHVDTQVPVLAIPIKRRYEETVRTLLEARADVKKYTAQEVLAAALCNDATARARDEQQQRLNSGERSTPQQIAHHNEVASSDLNHAAPTLFWYAALKQQERLDGYSTRIFEMVFNNTPPEYCVPDVHTVLTRNCVERKLNEDLDNKLRLMHTNHPSQRKTTRLRN